MRARHTDTVVAFGLFILGSATVWAAEPQQVEPQKVAALATDSPVTPTTAEVAREVVRLQEEMGGSIAAGIGTAAEPNRPAPAPRRLPYVPVANPFSTTYEGMRPSPVQILREIAWQLEESANRLEVVDLYDQADALRSTAHNLRLDARKLKAESTATKPQ